MKKYNKILEAILKGINIALDDFEDTEILTQKESKLSDKNLTKDIIDLYEYAVDMGLPSGTLWCKYNLGVDPNNLKMYKDWWGDFYAWGEIEPNKNTNGTYDYSWLNYKHSGISVYCERMTKYCTDKHAGVKRIDNDENNPYTLFADGLTLLLKEDDAAYQNFHFKNFKFHIPTVELFEELIKYSDFKYHKLYGDDGIRSTKGTGLFAISKKTGNKIFFPFGSMLGPESTFPGGYYWTSTLNPLNNKRAYYWCAGSNFLNIDTFLERYCGMLIRPVINLK